MINIIECHLNYIDIEIEKYHSRFNYHPVLICNHETKVTLQSYCNSLKPPIKIEENHLYSYKNCHILIDNTMQFGMIDIR